MKSPGGSYSRILGDMETATQERGIGRLRPGQDQEWLGLVLGLDVRPHNPEKSLAPAADQL